MTEFKETMVRVKVPTATALKRVGGFDTSYDEVIKELLKKAGHGKELLQEEKKAREASK